MEKNSKDRQPKVNTRGYKSRAIPRKETEPMGGLLFSPSTSPSCNRFVGTSFTLHCRVFTVGELCLAEEVDLWRRRDLGMVYLKYHRYCQLPSSSFTHPLNGFKESRN